MYELEFDAAAAQAHTDKYFKVNPSPYNRGLVLRKDGNVIAATVYTQYNGSNIYAHWAGTPGEFWLTRGFLFNSFHFPFKQLGCNRITATVDADNLPAIRLNERLGFRQEAVLRRAGSHGQDVLMYVMFREECKHG